MSDQNDKLQGLDLLRKPFPANLINKLPKPTKKQTEEVKADFRKGTRCTICGTWHHPDVVHLDYVGHAALTDRLLEADIGWTWEPMAVGNDGYPVIDANGGMWIKLTVCGVTRLGYGDAQGKVGGDAMKERIGDALRNASMRFGAALDLWHKGGDLHADDDADPVLKNQDKPKPTPVPEAVKAAAAKMKEADKRKQAAPAPAIEGTATTITGDPSEGDLSVINPPVKPTQEELQKVIDAFDSIAFTKGMLEKEYDKKLDDWTTDDIDEARKVYRLKADERRTMLEKIAAERAAAKAGNPAGEELI